MAFTETLWRDTAHIPKFKPLTEDLNVDAVIVGGGITGISAAYLLAKEGLKIALLEADNLLNGTTGHTTAKITAQHDLVYDELISHLGEHSARLYYEANAEAMHFIKETVHDLQIECDLSIQDAFLYATTEQSARKLEKEWQAYAKLGMEGELVQEIPFPIKVHNALKMNRQAQFHPLRYLTRLVKEVVEAGGLIFEGTTAVNIDTDRPHPAVLTKNGVRATGKRVLVCSHFPFYEGTGFYSGRLHADRSYVLACKTKQPYPGGMYLSVDEPSRSLRSAAWNGETVVLVGGEGHKTGQGKDTRIHYNALEVFGQEAVGLEQILYRWSTQDLVSLDKVPYVGPITSSQPHVLVATGYRKWGMTNGTAAAQLLKDLVMERGNPYEALYTPARFHPNPSVKRFFMENANVAKHLIKGKMEQPDIRPEDLSEDQGAVVSINGERKGAYKDRQGKLHIVDTTCTHIGCEVNWNAGDRTWDCPCHGSRFSYSGEVIEGPAEKPLARGHHNMLDSLTGRDSGY